MKDEAITVEDLKRKHGFPTSEGLLSIDQQPEANCDYINNVIKDLKTTFRNVIGEIDSSDISDQDKKNIKWYVDEFENYVDNFEELRTRMENLRDWGQQWKTLAKEMLRDLPKESQEKYLNI